MCFMDIIFENNSQSLKWTLYLENLITSIVKPLEHLLNLIILKLNTLDFFRSYQVRGHLAAQIDPLGLNNMEKDKARNMIIRSVKVDEKDFETEFQLPTTTWIGGEQKSLPLKEIINR